MVGKPTAKALKDSGKATGAKLSRKAKRQAERAVRASNPVSNLVLADLALRGGGELLRHVVERAFLTPQVGKERAARHVKSRTMGQTLLSTALARVATRSVPGAIVVGGGMLAKTLYDRRRARSEARGKTLIITKSGETAEE